VLARAPWALGDRARAVAHAESARTQARELGAREDFRTEIERWLGTHRP
jgi:hypothetical protein